jgi:hypothetical protein
MNDSLFDEPGSDIAKIDADELMALWNAAAFHFGLHAARELTNERRRRCARLLKGKPSRSYWQDVIERITQSSFCKGANNRGWRADFDFLTRRDTHVKVLEGKYDDNASGGHHRGAARGRAFVYDETIATLPMRRVTGGH